MNRRHSIIISLLAALIIFPFNIDAQSPSGAESPADSTLVIGTGVARIEEYAYSGRNDIKKVVFLLPTSVKEIGRNAFRECQALEEVVIPEGVVKIGMNAFAYCDRLSRVGIPPTVKNIESNAFSFCSSLKDIELPESVTELESYAFSECTSLERAVLPPNHSLLGELIFSGCHSLQEIYELSETPPAFDCNSTLFDPPFSSASPNPYSHCVLKVKTGRADIYRKAYPWSLFSTIIEIP